MSLKYRDVTGKETPIAGLNGLSGELVPSVSYYQSGTKSLTQSATQFNTETITLTNAMPNSDYCVNISATGSNLLGVVQFPTVISKTTSAFTVAWINDTSKAAASDTLQITWQAFKLMTDESRAVDEAAIAQNASDIAALTTKLDNLTLQETSITLALTDNSADNMTLRLHKMGKMVVAEGVGIGTKAGKVKTNWATAGTVPAGYRPKQFEFTTLQHNSSTIGVQFNTNGTVALYDYTGNNSMGYERAIHITYFTA